HNYLVVDNTYYPGNYTIEIYDLMGTLILCKRVNGKTRIYLDDLNAGIYVCKLYVNGETVIKKVIIQ
ncbi:MAG TPA: T9SS type A sorting domain-containing protein, partial [Bacteroidales bacterium]|nr:T9SS type A sorting domain-containing protein [Bacteroidales bacterium]